VSPRVGKRRRLERGIYEDATGRSVVATVAGEQREQRWPPHTPITTLRLARAALQTALVDEQARAAKKRPADGTLAADVAAYLKTLPKGRMREDAAMLLGHWTTALGTRPRADIKPSEIRATISAWLDEGKTKATCNRRRAALTAFWHAVDGKAAANPVRDVAKFPEHTQARDIRRDALDYILAALPRRTAKGRWWRAPVHLRVFAETGWPPALIQQLEDHQLHLDARPPYVEVAARDKGEGTDAQVLPVTPQAAAALRDFRAAKAFGPISRNTLRRVFLGAVARARRAWQADKRGPWPVSPKASPYWLRHAFGNRAIDAAKRDVKAVQTLMLHATPHTTERYLKASVPRRAQATVDALAEGVILGTALGTDEERP
jgi:integrase